MDQDEYQIQCQRTFGVHPDSWDAINNCLLGLAGEAGELIELFKKYKYHNHTLDYSKVIKEAGDVYYYLATLCYHLGMPLSDVAERNIEKLRARYPDRFDPELSRNRKDGDV